MIGGQAALMAGRGRKALCGPMSPAAAQRIPLASNFIYLNYWSAAFPGALK